MNHKYAQRPPTRNNIFPTESEDDFSAGVQTPAKKRVPIQSREGISLGGQTSDTPWTTTLQAASHGKTEAKKGQGLRRVQGDQPTALWGETFDAPPTRAKSDRTLTSQMPSPATSTISEDVLNRLREEIKQRGATGIAGLQRKFRIIDVLYNVSRRVLR